MKLLLLEESYVKRTSQSIYVLISKDSQCITITLFSLVTVAMVGLLVYSIASLSSTVHACICLLSILNVHMLLRAMDTVMVNKSGHMPTLWENPMKVVKMKIVKS